MELSDPATPDTSFEMHDSHNRRKSGRQRQKPVLLQRDPNLSQVSNGIGAKRKLKETHEGDHEDAGDADEDEDEGTSPGESDPDEEELKERRKRASKKGPAKSAPKKPKISNATITNLAVRPAVNGAKKSSKPKKPRAKAVGNAEDEGSGLYCTCDIHGI